MKIAITLMAGGLLILAGCKTPYVEPMESVPLKPQLGETVQVDHLLVLVDSSGSISRRALYPEQKALVESFIGTLPDGEYEAGSIAFGGYDRDVTDLGALDREALQQRARDAKFLSESTQIDRVFNEVRDDLVGRSGRVAIVLFSDGRSTAPGGWRSNSDEALTAARSIITSRSDLVCFYSINTSNDAEGGAFLRELSELTDCGAYRASSDLGDVAAMHALQRKMFISDIPPAVAATLDTDGDGVPDIRDLCPNSREGQFVLANGCIAPTPLYFEPRSTTVDDPQGELPQLADFLTHNPEWNVRIDGYADGVGGEEYNEVLSERRATAVREALEGHGIAPDRISVEGIGDKELPYPPDSDENRAADRRIEIFLERADAQ